MKLADAKAALGIGLTFVAWAAWLGYVAYVTARKHRDETRAKLILAGAQDKRAELLQQEGVPSDHPED